MKLRVLSLLRIGTVVPEKYTASESLIDVEDGWLQLRDDAGRKVLVRPQEQA